MAAPLYFFAGRSVGQIFDGDRFQKSVLSKYGLDSVWRDVVSPREESFVAEMTAPGPGGASGTLVSALPTNGNAHRLAGYYPNEQTWIQVASDLWIGKINEEPISPSDLVRHCRGKSVPVDGYFVDLADGNTWVIPIIRRPGRLIESGYPPTNLPQSLGWNAEGEFVRFPPRDHVDLWEETGKLCEIFFSGNEGDRHYEVGAEGVLLALRFLSVNYRIGRHEQTLLGLIDNNNLWPLLGLTVDYPAYQEAFKQKKNLES